MVVFACNNCGESLKKGQVEKHFTYGGCSGASVSCMDCHRDFGGNSYTHHIKCISEQDKYSGGQYKVKESTLNNEHKRNVWTDVIKNVAEKPNPNRSKGEQQLLDFLTSITNSTIPRQWKSFHNFILNGARILVRHAESVWSMLEQEKQLVAAQDNMETGQVTSQVVTNGDGVCENGSVVKDGNATQEHSTMDSGSSNMEDTKKSVPISQAEDIEFVASVSCPPVTAQNVKPEKKKHSKKVKSKNTHVHGDGGTSEGSAKQNSEIAPNPEQMDVKEVAEKKHEFLDNELMEPVEGKKSKKRKSEKKGVDKEQIQNLLAATSTKTKLLQDEGNDSNKQFADIKCHTNQSKKSKKKKQKEVKSDAAALEIPFQDLSAKKTKDDESNLPNCDNEATDNNEIGKRKSKKQIKGKVEPEICASATVENEVHSKKQKKNKIQKGHLVFSKETTGIMENGKIQDTVKNKKQKKHQTEQNQSNSKLDGIINAVKSKKKKNKNKQEEASSSQVPSQAITEKSGTTKKSKKRKLENVTEVAALNKELSVEPCVTKKLKKDKGEIVGISEKNCEEMADTKKEKKSAKRKAESVNVSDNKCGEESGDKKDKKSKKHKENPPQEINEKNCEEGSNTKKSKKKKKKEEGKLIENFQNNNEEITNKKEKKSKKHKAHPLGANDGNFTEIFSGKGAKELKKHKVQPS